MGIQPLMRPKLNRWKPKGRSNRGAAALFFLVSHREGPILICVGTVEAQIPATGAPPVWQYISLPRSPVEPDEPQRRAP